MDSIDFYDKRRNKGKKKGLEMEWKDLKKAKIRKTTQNEDLDKENKEKSLNPQN